MLYPTALRCSQQHYASAIIQYCGERVTWPSSLLIASEFVVSMC
nr:hypothetical protein [Crenothrix polyspora]